MKRPTTLLGVCVLSVLGLGSFASAQVTTNWSAFTGAWTTPGNWSNGLPDETKLTYIDNGGTAQIVAGDTITSGDLRVGWWGTGTISQSGGSFTLPYYWLNLAYQSGSGGTYNLSGGTFTTNGMTVGYKGVGRFTQTGGTANIQFDMEVGYFTGSNSVYDMSGGSLSARDIEVGYYGTGRFKQSAGTTTFTGLLSLGGSDYESGGLGYYDLSGTGDLTVGTVYVGEQGRGTFTHTGGTHTASTLSISKYSQSTGTYSLSGSTSRVSATTLYVGDGGVGTFNHPSGSVDAGTMYVGYWGYAYYNLASNGTYNLSGTGSLSANDATVGYDGKGKIVQTGGTNTIRNTLTLGQGARSTGTYELSAGQFSAGNLLVGRSGSGTFKQTGGTATISDTVTVGLSGSTTTYPTDSKIDISAGQLTANTIRIGTWKTNLASVSHTGGTVTASSSVIVGSGSQSVGTYTIGGTGQLSTGRLDVGPGGVGTFNHNGGTVGISGNVNVGGIDLGRSRGTYNLVSGQLSASNVYVATYETADFDQTGGTNTISQALYLGQYAGSNGTYKLSAGSLSAANEHVGYSGTGTFIQTGGTNTINGKLYIGSTGSTSAAGTYRLSGGTSQLKATSQVRIGADSGTGRLEWSGGTIETPSLAFGSKGTLAMGYNFNAADLSTGALLKTGGTVTGTSSATLELMNGATAMQDKGVVSWGTLLVNGGTSYGLSGNGQFTASTTKLVGAVSSAAGSLAQSSGTANVTNLYIGNDAGTYGSATVSGGRLNVGNLYVGGGNGGILNVTNAGAEVYVSSSLHLLANSTLTAAPGTVIHMTGSTFNNRSTDPAKLAGLADVNMIFEGGTTHLDTFEVAGQDMGVAPAGWVGNFTLGTLTLGSASAVGRVQLVNAFDNLPGWAGTEALYANNLFIGPGSYLDLNGLTLYYETLTNTGGTVALNGGQLVAIPEPGALCLFGFAGLALARRRGRKH